MKVVSQRFGARMFSSHLGLHCSFQCKVFNVSLLQLCKHGKEKMYCSFCLLKGEFISVENEQSTYFHLQCGGLFIKQRLKTVLGLFFIN